MVPIDKLMMEHAEQLRRLQYDEVSLFEKLQAATHWLATLDEQARLRVSHVPESYLPTRARCWSWPWKWRRS